jgi:glycosyltransferase 2 family protein
MHVAVTKLLRAFIGFAIGGMLLWLALRGEDVEDVLAVWARSDGSWLLLGTAIYGTSLIVRVARWSCLLAVVVQARTMAVGEVLLVGNAINNILPARLGELFRADYGKRRLGSTRSVLLATIVVERLADLAAIVAALLGAMIVLEPMLRDTGKPWQIIKFAAMVGVCLLAAALTVVVALPRMQRISHWLPGFARSRLDDLVVGVQSWGEVRKSRFVTLTLGVWSLEALALVCVLRASGIDFGLFQLLLVLGLANLSTLVPTAPAYLGSYQFSYAVAFAALGWSSAQGIAVATTAQVFLLVPVTVLGVLTLIFRSTPGWAWTGMSAERVRSIGTSTATAEQTPNGDC